jgi:DNA polymerase III delta prime subunit
VRHLATLAADPFPSCRLLVGPPGCGKTTAALAFAAELGCRDEWTDLHVLCGADLSIDAARELWRGPLNSVARSTSRFMVLVIEELERLSPPTQIFLKDALERNLPSKTIVLATSNSTGKLDAALLQRFGQPLKFSGGASFAAAAICRLGDIWQIEARHVSPPAELARWGWDESSGQYSLRSALDAMQDFLILESAA